MKGSTKMASKKATSRKTTVTINKTNTGSKVTQREDYSVLSNTTLILMREVAEQQIKEIIAEGQRRTRENAIITAPMKTDDELFGRGQTMSSSMLNPYNGDELPESTLARDTSPHVEGMGK